MSSGRQPVSHCGRGRAGAAPGHGTARGQPRAGDSEGTAQGSAGPSASCLGVGRTRRAAMLHTQMVSYGFPLCSHRICSLRVPSRARTGTVSGRRVTVSGRRVTMSPCPADMSPCPADGVTGAEWGEQPGKRKKCSKIAKTLQGPGKETASLLGQMLTEIPHSAFRCIQVISKYFNILYDELKHK